MRILIIRHGDPNYEKDCLTEKGKREAMLLAQRLKNEKIDYFYSSPLGRAYETCMHVAKAQGKENDVQILPWLREFDHPVTWPDGTKRPMIWDMLPEFWTQREQMYDSNTWYAQDFYQNSEVEKAYKEVGDSLNELLCTHGYKREGNLYKVEKSHTETIAFFCHFGLEMVLLSHLCHISPIPLLHNFVAAPTSVTTLYTEERRKGIASFRCCGFGDTGHLYVGNEPPSFSARFCEIYDSTDRHD
ncbi:MAG: histidine phosphatase family protein [Clostridia bacterium]|nr:histidine phosphatase family protein [Clostridia bacterium]